MSHKHPTPEPYRPTEASVQVTAGLQHTSFRTTRAILARARNHGRAAASQGLAAGSLLADRAEASPAHRSADPEPIAQL